MSTKPPPPAAPAPRASREVRSPAATVVQAIDLGIEYGAATSPDRIVIVGTGGIGKSTLASYLPEPLFFDTEGSVRKFEGVQRTRVSNWRELRGKLASVLVNPPKGVRSIIVDTMTVGEEQAKEYVVSTRKTNKGRAVASIEEFGWGTGWQFVHDEVNGLLADLDRLNELGYIVCLITHVVASPAPNPNGEDYLRWEPMLYSGDKKERGSIRKRVFNWAEHVLFIGYDVHVEDGRGQGSGSRTIYTSETPTHMAKSRTRALALPYTVDDPGAVWRELGIV